MIPEPRYGRRAVAWLARFWRDRFTLLIVVFAGLGTAHILARAAAYGERISIGCKPFLSTALNFLAGAGWRDFMGDPLTMWPPLLPLLLAAFGWVGIEPLEAGRWINATAFGLTILAAGCWLRSNLRSQWLTLAATAIIAGSLPLSHLVPFIRPTPLFVLFTLLALMQLATFLNRRTTASLWWAAIFTALAALTRYPGVALICTGVLVLLPLARLKHTLVFGAISSVPLLAVLAHNWAVTGDLTQATGDRTGPQSPSGQSLSEGLYQTVEVFREWTVPPNAPDGVAYLLWLAVAVVATVVPFVRCRGRHRPISAWGPLPFGVFAVIYLAFIIVVVPFTVNQGVDSRYLLPIYVPLLLTAALLLDRFLSIEAARRVAAVRYVVASLVLLATLAHVGFSARENLRRTTLAYDGVVFRRRIAKPFNAKRQQRYAEQLIQQASERVVRAGWTVYRTERKLIYRKEPCAPADVQAKFILHVVPADPANLPADRRQYGSVNLDFYFDWDSQQRFFFRLGDQCIAIAHLPTYAIDRIHVGQWISKEDRTLWEAELTPGR